MPIHASEQTIAALRRRFRRLDHCELVSVDEHPPMRIGPVTITALLVPHARERHIPTSPGA